MAFEQPDEISAFASDLGDLADTLDERIADGIDAGELEEGDADTLSRHASELRSQAEALLEDAANYVVEDCATDQAELLDLIEGAKAKIHQLENVHKIASLVGALVILAASLGQGAPAIAAALDKVRRAS
jgi:hypothetical protein